MRVTEDVLPNPATERCGPRVIALPGGSRASTTASSAVTRLGPPFLRARSGHRVRGSGGYCSTVAQATSVFAGAWRMPIDWTDESDNETFSFQLPMPAGFARKVTI